MRLRIRFSSEIYIEGKDIAEISDKWAECELFSAEAKKHEAGFIGIDSVQDVDTYKDVMNEWNDVN